MRPLPLAVWNRVVGLFDLFDRINLIWDINILFGQYHMYDKQKDSNRQSQAHRCVDVRLESILRPQAKFQTRAIDSDRRVGQPTSSCASSRQ